MNAIAIECHQLDENTLSPLASIYLDPFNGIADLKEKKIRMVAPENLADDPLRILRGYRQAAQLGFEIEDLTRQVLIKLAPRLKLIAAERVRTELGYLLSITNGSKWMVEAVKDRILEDWLPSQSLNLTRFTKAEERIAALLVKFPALELFFNKNLTGDRHAIVITKLAALTNSATSLEKLGLSRTEQRWLVGILRYLPYLIALLNQASPKEKYKLFQPTLEFFPAIALLALASDYPLEAIAPWLEHWLNPHDAIAYPVALITGDELQKELGIAPSPKIGELLESIKIAQVESKIQSKAEAIAFVQSLIG
jgi:tRNA nucleotidyltransferase (CCA-adding enzyme)